MKVTKYEHSCLVVEEQGQKLVIDPGAFTKSFIDYKNIVVVVVTHVHQDHFDVNQLNQIVKANPGVAIFGTQEVADEFGTNKVSVVTGGESKQAGNFKLDFYGGEHELFTNTQNIGVLVNDQLYYPGDSYSKPDKEIAVLAAPASAPWLRISEASQFIKDCKPKKAFPTHNALLSEIGESIQYRMLSEAAKESGSEWLVLVSGESLEI